MLRTTLGRMLVNDALPEELRDHNRVLDKKGLSDLMRQLALKHPDKYVEVSKKLTDIGREASTEGGGNSFGLQHMRKAKASLAAQKELDAKLKRILDDDNIDDKKRNDLIVKTVGSMQSKIMDDILKESLDENNPLAFQVISGARGNKMNLASLRGSDLLYADHRDEVIPLPVRRSYSQGLSPIEYWAGTYGARRGVMATKFATQDAGFLSKQLNQVAHRLMVVDEDYDDPEQQKILRGVPSDVNDMDNEGALLAHDVGDYKRNTVLTPKIMKDLERRGIKRVLLRSPMVGGSPEGGVYARDVGIRERGVLPGRGEQVGLTAAQALSEPISQGQLSAKHSGGVAGQEKAVSGFQAINQLIQAPKQFKGVASHSEEDGRIDKIEEAPAGGHYVYINGKQHYVARGYNLKVKPGDEVEAGDVLSDGIPHPSIVVQHKGIGEGRRYFVKAMRDAMTGSGMKAHRRNIEVLSRGLINHVRLTDEWGDHVPDDVVPYSTLEHLYKPREGAQSLAPNRAVGKYLERPVLHYSIGTKVRPSMLRDLEEFGVQNLDVHDEPPPFQPEMIRGMASLQHDPDWMTRMYGSGLKTSLLDAVHRGAKSNEMGTSFVPGLARAVDFGRQGLVRQPEPGKKPEEITPMPKPIVKPQQLDLAAIPKAPPPKPSGGMFGLFKLSQEAQAVEEARELLEKVARQMRPIQPSVPLKVAQQIRPSVPVRQIQGTRPVKLAFSRDGDEIRPGQRRQTPPAPATTTTQINNRPVTFQSSTQLAGPVVQTQTQTQPVSHQVTQPTTQPTTQTHTAPPPVVSGGGGPAPVTQPQTQTQPVVRPGVTAPQGQWDVWARARSQGGQQPTTGINPHALATGGYRPGMGMLWNNDSPEQFAQFVAGNPHGDHNAGYGGFVGALTRFGSGLDGNAVAALTGQSPYVRGHYHQPGPHPEFDGPMGPGMDGVPFEPWMAGAGPGPGGQGGPAGGPQETPVGQPIPGTRQMMGPYGPLPEGCSLNANGQPVDASGQLLRPGQRGGPPATTTIGSLNGLARDNPMTALAATAVPAALAEARLLRHAPGAMNFMTGAQRYGRVGQALNNVPVVRTLLGLTPQAQQGAQATSLAGGRLAMAGRALGYAQIALGAADVGSSYLEGGWEGGRQHGLNHAQRLREHFTNPGIMTPLNIVGDVWNPVANVNTIVHGGVETYHAARELAEQTAVQNRVGREEMQRYMSGRNPHMYNPLRQNDMQYRTPSEAWRAMANNPYEVGTVVPEAIMEISRLRGAGGALAQQAAAQEAQYNANAQERLAQLDLAHRAWLAAGQPGGQWRDPGTGLLYGPGQRSDRDNIRRTLATPNWNRQTQGMHYGESLFHDIATRQAVLPGLNDAAIPGTSAAIRRFATPSEIWNGNFTFNPFKWRDD